MSRFETHLENTKTILYSEDVRQVTDSEIFNFANRVKQTYHDLMQIQIINNLFFNMKLQRDDIENVDETLKDTDASEKFIKIRNAYDACNIVIEIHINENSKSTKLEDLTNYKILMCAIFQSCKETEIRNGDDHLMLCIHKDNLRNVQDQLIAALSMMSLIIKLSESL